MKNLVIGDTYFYRDMIHPKYVVERSIKATHDELVGSGRLTFVNDFIRDLYFYCKLEYDKYITEDREYNHIDSKIFYKETNISNYSYDSLLKNTLKDIEFIKNI